MLSDHVAKDTLTTLEPTNDINRFSNGVVGNVSAVMQFQIDG